MIDGLKPYPKMEDSGVPWLGNVPEHWEVKTIGRMGRLFKGNGGSKADEVAVGVPCVRYGDLYTRHEFFIQETKACVSTERAEAYTPIEYGDLLFAASGETMEDIGRSSVNLLRSPAYCGGDILVLRPEVPVNPRFLGYAADAPSSRHQKATMGRGFTVVHVYASQIKQLVLPVPPLPEQAAIVRFLDHADRLIRRYIRAKKKLIALLNEQKQAIVHQAVTRGLDPGAKLKHSGVEWLGDIPEHWEVRRLRTLVRHIDQGVSPQAEARLADEQSWGVLKAGCVNHGVFRPTEHKRLPADFEIDPSIVVNTGDVLVSRACGSPHLVGSVARATSNNYNLILSDKIFRLVFKDDGISNFLVAAMNAPYYRRQVRLAISGAEGLANNLPLSSLRDFLFFVPPTGEASLIHHSLDRDLRQIQQALEGAEREISLLQEFRTRLIADVVTGKLDVREAATRLPEDIEEPEPIDEPEEPFEDSEAFDEASLEEATIEAEAS